jgi:hypothetical protein
MGAALRHFMFDDKKASWYYSLSTGLMVEVFHMLLIFLTHMDGIEAAFQIVKNDLLADDRDCWPHLQRFLALLIHSFGRKDVPPHQ